MEHGTHGGETRLRAKLTAAEIAAREAAQALLVNLEPKDSLVVERVDILRDYCTTCPDPFQALDIARLLRALVDDMESDVYAHGEITEWAHAEVRIQSLCSRTSRLLRDQRALEVEQALIDLSVMHLRCLEEGPNYPEILAAMGRILDSSVATRPVGPVEEFFGLARTGFQLPTQPPAPD